MSTTTIASGFAIEVVGAAAVLASDGIEVLTRSTQVPLEHFSSAPSHGVVSSHRRKEAELVARYRRYLSNRGIAAARWLIKPSGEHAPLYTDIYDVDRAELFEAKAPASRNNIRTAIGQLLDYRRHIPVDELSLALLLPARPSGDLVDLLRSLSIACVYETNSGAFHRIGPVPTRRLQS
jgi:hypothetical protein